MKCQILFSTKNKKDYHHAVSSAEFAHSMVNVQFFVSATMKYLIINNEK